jgi:hypothetical protein
MKKPGEGCNLRRAGVPIPCQEFENMSHVTRRSAARKIIRPNVPAISKELAAARAAAVNAAKTMDCCQAKIDLGAIEIAIIADLLAEETFGLCELARAVNYGASEQAGDLDHFIGLTDEAFNHARQLATDLRDWAEARAPLSTAVAPAASAKKGGAR